MGSPLGPLLADVFMGKLETNTLQPVIDGMIVYRRCVDDIFIVSNSSNIDAIFSHFNGAHPAIKFTYEVESDSSFSFQ